jgi:hypothetical protein
MVKIYFLDYLAVTYNMTGAEYQKLDADKRMELLENYCSL